MSWDEQYIQFNILYEYLTSQYIKKNYMNELQYNVNSAKIYISLYQKTKNFFSPNINNWFLQY